MTAQPKADHVPLDVVVGTNVHSLMWARRMTQTELGRAIGVDQSTLGKKLRGDRGWSLDQVESAAEVLGVDAAYLMDRQRFNLVHPRGLEPGTHCFSHGVCIYCGERRLRGG